jgi:hypothetical protein
MRTTSILFILMIWGCMATGQVSFGEPQLFNQGWKFAKGDFDNARSTDFDDTRWRSLNLPHDWSVEGPYSPNHASATGYLPGGIAWYRKTFNPDVSHAGKRIYIYFEGIYRDGEVFINGTSLGMRPNGYISYMHDLTPHIKQGENNTLAVRVDHSKSADSRWYTGSGIYRNVWLIYAGPVHIAQWGIFYTTTEISEKQATVKTETTVANHGDKPVGVTVNQELFDNNGRSVGKTSAKLTVPAGSTQPVTQNMKVNQPSLWSVDSPALYQLKTTVVQGKEIIDQTTTTAGFRKLGFDPEKGFSLNGKYMKVKGVCLHHDAGSLGSAVPREVWQRRLETLKSMGCNAIRTSHNPQAPDLYQLADELGFLIINEAFDEWEFPKKKWLEGWNQGSPGFQGHAEFFGEWAETDLRDMILRDRNHPSVFMWSIGNEVDYPNDPYSHPILNKEGIQQQHTAGFLPNQPHADRLGGIAKRLAAIVREHDSSRPVTAGLAGPIMSNETEYPGALDVVGYNYTESRYAMDHAQYPERVLYGSENGHSMDAWKAVRDNEYIFGQFLWTGIDYLGESHRWPSRGFTSGLIDLAGYKKPRAYFRESLWSEKPMAYLGTYPQRRNERSPSVDALPVWNYNEGDMIRVVCYTNGGSAKLLLNGREVGEEKPYDDQTGIIHWDIPFSPGKLEVISYKAGQEAARFALETSQRPQAISAKAWKETISKDRGVAQIEIQIVDKDGKPVVLADEEIICTTEGPVKLLRLEASNPRDKGDYTGNRLRVFQGKMIAYVEATGEPGKATVNFSSQWLDGAKVEIITK